MLTIASVNVNGIRAATRKGGLEWLSAADLDVVLLQEVRATRPQFDESLAGTPLGGWNWMVAPAEQLGRAGVAIGSPWPLSDVEWGVGLADPVHSGRWIEATVDVPARADLRVASVYVHSGEAGTARQDAKYAFLEAMTGRLECLRRERTGPVVLGGDLNVAHTDADLKNWKGNRNKAGCLPEERAFLDRWIQSGWTDLGRHHAGQGLAPYTWWSMRGKAFDTDTGWRIDYLFANEELASDVATVSVARAAAYDQRWSDHAPLVAEFVNDSSLEETDGH